MAGSAKPRVICPYCQRDGQTLQGGAAKHFSFNGMTAHTRANHQNDYKDWQDNKDAYLVSHACDDAGTPVKGGSPAAGSFPEPEPEPDDEEYIIEELDDDDPEPEPEPKSKPEPKPEPEPDPEPKPDPGYRYNPYGFCD